MGGLGGAAACPAGRGSKCTSKLGPGTPAGRQARPAGVPGASDGIHLINIAMEIQLVGTTPSILTQSFGGPAGPFLAA